MGCCCCFDFHSKKVSREPSSAVKKHCSQERLLGVSNPEVLNSSGKVEEGLKRSQLNHSLPSLERSGTNKWLGKHHLNRGLVKDSKETSGVAEPDKVNGGIKACSRVPVKQTYHEVRSEDVDGNKIINQYVRGCKLGMGSYGKVVLHRSISDHRLYALKVDIMKLLDHPNIVRLEELIDDPESDNFYMVLEYVEGRAMFEGCGPPGGIGESTSRRYFRGILAGLIYLHNHNIVHGDIKPENLLVTAEGQIKIGDFGRSRIFEDGNDMMRRSPGTPVFSAPECCLGAAYHGKAADIWALGVTLYCMLLGRYPFFGETLQKIYEKIVNEPLFLPEEMNKDLKLLLAGLLCKDTNQRLSLDAVALHPWVCKGYGPLEHKTAKSGQIIAKKYDIFNGQEHGLELSNLR
ncbi:hypothetical protein O6H91_08G069500 [Diphasiastrum complanatum]|uniref:Uncharacterized protein n=2 Tax=Diphasiastrum complanatum TaxID=34168 RepID=A0ACC2CYN1_DIPCM|nr:hypothetical protein O6H91_08G069500 [Diphasiastrum complanatum]KAJ7547110.1 hypothetical protein O6H91_08G069500 [Diphasiastrum complanatum]